MTTSIARRALVVCSVALVLLVVSAAPSHAWWRAGVYVSPPVFVGPGVIVGPPVYPVPYYAPAPVVVQSAPPVYEQQPPQPYWYYCQNPGGYYPYVQQCPNGWLQVVPNARPAQ